MKDDFEDKLLIVAACSFIVLLIIIICLLISTFSHMWQDHMCYVDGTYATPECEKYRREK